MPWTTRLGVAGVVGTIAGAFMVVAAAAIVGVIFGALAFHDAKQLENNH